MRKIIWMLMVLALALSGAALAEGMPEGVSVVFNCDEWVSLRSAPDTGSERLEKVPLGATVTGCEDAGAGFTRCVYQGKQGYILTEYLCNDDSPFCDSFQISGMTVLGARRCEGVSETMFLTCLNDVGETLWSRVLHSEYATELDSTEVFPGGTADMPRVMTFVASEGLAALDAATGEPVWTLDREIVDFGGSLTTLTMEDGTMYVGGYYGPDPVAISMDGQVLWQSDAGNEDVYWLYALELTDEGLVGTYESVDGNVTPGKICYDLDGNTLWIRPGVSDE